MTTAYEDKLRSREKKLPACGTADRVKIDGRPSIGSLNRCWLHTRQNAAGRATYPQHRLPPVQRASRCFVFLSWFCK